MADIEEEDVPLGVFNPDEVKAIIENSVKQTLSNVSYNVKKIDQWTSNIIEEILKRLAELKKPFKYVVTCIVQQRTGAGLHSAFSANWDISGDGVCSDTWSNDSMHCVTTVFAVGI
eukprot:GEZU01021913.1.p1 GENE.GEZU01021913.1~~GEZU01021913.1.p1  ORF type:complete len:116 (+),score=18.15 GEZU01021913.1:107-454(+)